jgi:hypothetical protein
VHRIALQLVRQANLPWVADLRDPLLNDISGQPGREYAQAMRRLERAVLGHASTVVTTCPTFTRELADRYPRRAPGSITTITNGFDRDDLLHAWPTSAPFARGGPGETCTLFHAGACYGRIQIAGLVSPLQRVLDRHPEWHGRVRLLVAGTLDRRQEERWSRDCPEWMTLAGYQGHPEVIRAAAAAACSVILLPDCGHARRCIPGKTFELLALPTHILGLAPAGSDTERLVSTAGASTTVPFEDEPGVAAALERIISAHFAGRLQHRRDWPAIDAYDRRAIAARFAECLHSARGQTP